MVDIYTLIIPICQDLFCVCSQAGVALIRLATISPSRDADNCERQRFPGA
jgi:hypothetical protein